ncbi:hypothetical protein H696_03618 [Fonticula alba]|uniref:GPI transamidase component PIG-S n=1 Tax=Fonticula alba TaxID=691883 RepID=A0A058Z8A6_FONAL|nr:hypothetical protein H696_03618 [Fonticula alba]KCV70158.1 hypothetical protein H696_03618 [Fonticula alba]|eukprot:XP_009495764.1 hypothetical protein H696_03618 [Fonticula alba]
MADRAPVAAGASSPDADLSEAFSDKTRPRRWGALLAFILFSVLTLVPAYWVTMTVSRDAQFIPSAMGLAEEATALQADLKLVTLVVRAPVSACENAVTRFNQRIPPERRAWLRLRCYAERPALAMERFTTPTLWEIASQQDPHLAAGQWRVTLEDTRHFVLHHPPGASLDHPIEQTLLSIFNQAAPPIAGPAASGDAIDLILADSVAPAPQPGDGSPARVHVSISLLGLPVRPEASSMDAAHAFVDDLVGMARGLATLSSSVNYRFHAPLAVRPAAPTAAGQPWTINAADLAAFVNIGEWGLNDALDCPRTLHFVALIPPPRFQPLGFQPSDSATARDNILFVPQWGVLVVINPPPAGADPQAGPEYQDWVDATLRRVAGEVFAPAGRTLLGLAPPAGFAPSAGIPDSPQGRAFEREALAVRQLLLATEAVASRSRAAAALAEYLSTGPISPGATRLVELARSDVRAARDRLAGGPGSAVMPPPGAEDPAGLDLLLQALGHLRAAARTTGLASRDPDTLSPSPAAHFATPAAAATVYVPLFAPAAVPIVASLIGLLAKYLRSRRAARTQ